MPAGTRAALIWLMANRSSTEGRQGSSTRSAALAIGVMADQRRVRCPPQQGRSRIGGRQPGCVAACIWWTKARMGWREATDINVGGQEDKPVAVHFSWAGRDRKKSNQDNEDNAHRTPLPSGMSGRPDGGIPEHIDAEDRRGIAQVIAFPALRCSKSAPMDMLHRKTTLKR
jgi:hypothetical protein